MYGTIEPRLIALLNDTSPEYTHHYSGIALPPLQDPNILKSSGRPSPLEPDAGNRNVKHSALASQQRELPATAPVANSDVVETPKKPAPERALGGSSPQSLRKILDDPDTAESSSTKKRERVENKKEDFVQLPQPPKKQKAVKQSVPPIIIGLFEPPPQTAVFPPIASSSFHDSHGRNSLNIAPAPAHKESIPMRLQAKPKVTPNNPQEPTSSGKPPAKTRKKWTEEETNDVLKGVQKHGIGKWTQIQKDPEFKFNGRKAMDIKDRFRVICPDELRGKGSKSNDVTEGAAGSKAKPKTKSNPIFDNILVSSSSESESEDHGQEKESGPAVADSTPPKKPTSKAHRKKLSDLAKLGISAPFQPSSRRTRHPYTEEEDQAILKGFEEFGNQWAMIVKDPRLGLQHRKATDIRDRLRNRWPEKHAAVTENKEDKEKKTSGKVHSSITTAKKKSTQTQIAVPAHDTSTPSSQESQRPPLHLPSLPQPTAPTLFSLPSLSMSLPYDMPQSFNTSSTFSAPTQQAITSNTSSIPQTNIAATTAPSSNIPQFMTFSEMLNGDWEGNDGDGGGDVVGEMDISRLLAAMD